MKRRLISVLAVLAMGAAALAGAVPAAANEPDGTAYVALGDSQAAGTGNLPYVDSTCLVSKKSYPMLLGATLGMPFVTNACAGASTQDVMSGQLGDLGPATQLVTITAGINNLDWQSALAACGTAGQEAACAAAIQAATNAIQTIPLGIAQLLGAVRTLAPNAMIVVTGYPELFGDVVGTCTVGSFRGDKLTFTAGQTATINAGIGGVNAAVQAGIGGYVGLTGDQGVRFVGIDFDGHGLCDTGDRWISGLVSGVPTSARGFHPNAAGQQAFADAIAAALAP